MGQRTAIQLAWTRARAESPIYAGAGAVASSQSSQSSCKMPVGAEPCLRGLWHTKHRCPLPVEVTMAKIYKGLTTCAFDDGTDRSATCASDDCTALDIFLLHDFYDAAVDVYR